MMSMRCLIHARLCMPTTQVLKMKHARRIEPLRSRHCFQGWVPLVYLPVCRSRIYEPFRLDSSIRR